MRVGIHTGLVVVGEMGSGGRHEHLALGDTPNLAARLQGLAEPNTMVISEATSRLVHGYFTCHDLGTHALKGFETPVHVSQVLGESATQSRLEAAEATGLTPLVGREVEVTLLRERWTQSTEGLGQVVVLSGEAGIGKSRLIRVLTEQVVEAHTPRPTVRCSPYHTNSALYPVIEHLQRLLHWHRDMTPDARLTTLEQALQTAHLPLAEVVPLVAALLALPVPDRYPPLTVSPQRQKQQTLEALVAWLLADAAQQPVLAIWEDLHWADPSTLELLGLFLDQAPTARLLLVLTARPEFRLPWAPRSYMTPLTLTRLLRPQVEELVMRVTGGKPLPAEVLRQIVAKTDGIPLFVEELVKTILESGLVQEEAERYVLTGPLPPLAIPTTLQNALMARLDRLAPVKAVAQLGAVLGREFSYALLRAVAPVDEAELLYQRGRPPQATYLFKHALVQDAAYQSLLRSTRQQHHQRIAQVLETHFPEMARGQPELVAHHYTEASQYEEAVGYWYKAGQRAHERSAYVEAIAHLTKGLEGLALLPETPAHREQELTLRVLLGVMFQTTKGYGASELEQVYARARELCQQVRQSPQLVQVLIGLRTFYHLRGKFQMAFELGEQAVALAQQVQVLPLLAYAHHMLGHTLFSLGQFVTARGHCEHGITYSSSSTLRSETFAAPVHPRVLNLCPLSWCLWYLGYPDQAQSTIQEAVSLAQALSHPASLEHALSSAAIVHQLRAEASATQDRGEASLAVSQEQGFTMRLAMGTMLRGWALSRQGQADAGIQQLTQGMTAYRATGAEAWRHYWLTLLADAYGMATQPAEGLAALTEALALVEQNGECYYASEAHRLKGELLLLQSTDKQAEAEVCFHHALDIARQQYAKS